MTLVREEIVGWGLQEDPDRSQDSPTEALPKNIGSAAKTTTADASPLPF